MNNSLCLPKFAVRLRLVNDNYQQKCSSLYFAMNKSHVLVQNVSQLFLLTFGMKTNMAHIVLSDRHISNNIDFENSSC